MESELRALLERKANEMDRPRTLPDQTITRIQSRRAALMVAGVAVMVALVVIVWREAPQWAEAESVRPAHTGQVAPGLLPPLCGNALRNQTQCPPIRAGDFRSALYGLSTVWPFSFTLPDGWDVDVLPDGGGLDLFKGPRMGLSLIAYPQPVEINAKVDVPRPKRLAMWVSDHRSLIASSTPIHTTFAGISAWQVDVRIRDGATTTRRCRIGQRGSSEYQPLRPAATCVPLFGDYLSRSGDQALIAPLSGKTARLIFFTGTRAVTAAVWVWNLEAAESDSGPKSVQRMVASFHFEPQGKASK